MDPLPANSDMEQVGEGDGNGQGQGGQGGGQSKSDMLDQAAQPITKRRLSRIPTNYGRHQEY